MAALQPIEKKLPQIPAIEVEIAGRRLHLEKKLLNETILKIREKMRDLDKEHHILLNALSKYKAQRRSCTLTELKDGHANEPSNFKNYLTEPKISNLKELGLCEKEVAQINQTKLVLNQEFNQFQDVESDESD